MVGGVREIVVGKFFWNVKFLSYFYNWESIENIIVYFKKKFIVIKLWVILYIYYWNRYFLVWMYYIFYFVRL